MSETNPKFEGLSPNWGTNIKLIVGLTLVAIMGALLIRFQSLISVLVLAFIIIYLLHPLASWISTKTRISWRWSVNLIFLLLIIILVLSVTATSVAVVNQFESLIRVVQRFITDLPGILEDFLAQETVYVIPVVNYTVNVQEIISQTNLDVIAIGEQVLAAIQPILGQAGTILGRVAASAATGIGWGGFIFAVAYFVLADMGQVPDLLRNIELPGHMNDLYRLGRGLGRIWNVFVRGQLFVMTLIVVLSFILMSGLGVQYALGLSILAGLAKLLPYIGPLIAGVTTALVAFFQDGNYLGINPFIYAVVVVTSAVVLDQIFDSLVTPQIYGAVLGVHPAAVLVMALVLANLIGLVGLLLAAPVLASIQLLMRYILRKMVDLDPWPDPEQLEPTRIIWPLQKQAGQALDWLKNRLKKLRKKRR